MGVFGFQTPIFLLIKRYSSFLGLVFILAAQASAQDHHLNHSNHGPHYVHRVNESHTNSSCTKLPSVLHNHHHNHSHDSMHHFKSLSKKLYEDFQAFGCNQTICGNVLHFNSSDTTRLERLNSQLHSLQHAKGPKTIKIVVFSVWVGLQPLTNVTLLNHFLYCQRNDYEYRHFYYNTDNFTRDNGLGVPVGYASVIAAAELLQTSQADYFLKVDMDCLFARSDLRIETILDPIQQYSLYIQYIENSRFINSHTWILRNLDFGKQFIKEWLAYRKAMYCRDLAMEQGSLNLLIGRFTQRYYGANVTDYECDMTCHIPKKAYGRHHCVLDWFVDNNLDVNNHAVLFPELFTYYAPGALMISPQDGFTMQIESNGLNSKNRPLTVHPCKKGFYFDPDEVYLRRSEC